MEATGAEDSEAKLGVAKVCSGKGARRPAAAATKTGCPILAEGDECGVLPCRGAALLHQVSAQFKR